MPCCASCSGDGLPGARYRHLPAKAEASLPRTFQAEMKRHRDAIDPKAHQAFDVAYLAVVLSFERPDGTRVAPSDRTRLVQEFLAAWSASPAMIGLLVAVAARADAEDDILAVARAFTHLKLPGSSLQGLVEAAASLGSTRLSRALLGIVAPTLRRPELGKLNKLISGSPSPTYLKLIETSFAQVDDTLEPEVTLAYLLGEVDDEGEYEYEYDEYDDDDDESDDDQRIDLEQYVKALGLPMSGLTKLSRAERSHADAILSGPMANRQSALFEVGKLLARAYGARAFQAALRAFHDNVPF